MAEPDYLGKTLAQWIQSIRKGDAVERRLAAHALGELGPAAQAAVDDLVATLSDGESFVRVWAAAALARVDPARHEAIAALLNGMTDEQDFVRSLAAWHLGRLGSTFPNIDKAISPLQRLLDDEDSNVRTEAALALRSLEGKGAPPLELQFISRSPDRN